MNEKMSDVELLSLAITYLVDKYNHVDNPEVLRMSETICGLAHFQSLEAAELLRETK